VVAALNEARDRLTLFCVNRDPARAISAKVKLAGFRPAAARVQTLQAAAILDGNNEERPRRVVPVESSVPASPEFTYTFPAASVTVLELR
jgi:alpha-L-arabinofuranosidase